MNCKQAKGQLALLIGNDLDGSSVGEIQKHLGQCAGCREHLQQLSSCLEVLQVPAAGAFRADGESLWPRISVRLASPSAGQKPHRLSGWAPTLAVAAACLAMFWAASWQFSGTSSSSSSGPIEMLQPVDQPVDGPPHLYRPPQGQPSKGATNPARPDEQPSGTMPLHEDGPPVVRWID
ncbi:MAG TPA: hypothetical protein VFG04_25020 [Planctomycetaceae bacterium]|nr:hypothetical protein [Planctomycetaceae bacterium]